MADPKHALTELFDKVVAQFTADVTGVPNSFGWRALNKQASTSARIVWVPGDTVSNDAGRITPAEKKHSLTRSLGTLEEVCTVSIHARDAALPESERAQYLQCRTLFDAWFRAVRKAAVGHVQVKSLKWVRSASDSERRYGVALRVVLTIDAGIPDVPLGSEFNGDLAPGDTGVELDVSLLDHTEELET